MNTRFQNALKGIAQDIPPIWFMRQAGRYHKHYQGLKEKYTFMELCKQPELAAETALGPIQDFDFDVSILFSDLLFPLEALGMGLEYNPGPQLDRKLTAQMIPELRDTEEALEHLLFQKRAVECTREVLPKDKSLIGFVGGPWTLYTYAVEGAHKGNLIESKSQPELFYSFCEKLVPLLEKNIQLQLDGGVEVVMIFDTAAGEVSSGFYNRHIMPHLSYLFSQFPGKIGYYGKGTTPVYYQAMQNAPLAGIGVDHRYDICSVLADPYRPKGFVQGNFDQVLLFADTPIFETQLEEYLSPIYDLPSELRKGWVCGLGHGVLPKTPEKHVRHIVDRVRERFGK